MKRIILISFFCLIILILERCLDEINAPVCNAIIDCPAEYRICKEGYCFIEDEKCKEGSIKENDGCCPEGNIDRAKDNDCILFKDSFKGIFPSELALDSEGNIYFLKSSGEEKKLQGKLISYSEKGILRWHRDVGHLGINIPPLITSKGIYISTKGSVRRLLLNNGYEDVAIAVDGEIISNFSLDDEGNVSFLTNNGKVFIYSETKEDVVAKNNIMIKPPVFGPVFSSKKKIFYYTDKTGFLYTFNKNGKVKKLLNIGEVISQFIESDGIIFIPVMNGKLLILRNLDEEILLTDTLDIGENIVKQPLMDRKRNIYLFTDKGSIYVVEEKGGKGYVKLKKEGINDDSFFSGVLTENNNICYINGKGIVCEKIIENENLFIEESFRYENLGKINGSLRITPNGKITFLNEYQEILILYGDGTSLQKSPFPTLNGNNFNSSKGIY